MDRPDGAGGDPVEDFLAHYGVKGMKWGRRKADRLPASSEAASATDAVKKAKANSVKSLSNDELRMAIQRMQLESQFNQLRPKSVPEHARKFVTSTVLQIGKEQTTKIARDAASNQVAELLKKQ